MEQINIEITRENKDILIKNTEGGEIKILETNKD